MKTQSVSREIGLLVLSAWALSACHTERPIRCLPNVRVDERVSELRLQGASLPIVIKGRIASLIVYRNRGAYVAYERQALHKYGVGGLRQRSFS